MLRVIAGKFKSRKIKEVKSKLTRPTTDKNKEVLFNLLGQFFSGGAVLDLFAGSGSLGIEAISRGMESVDFVD
ncbi:MAG: RsmD family RNA methyltransferase, partial [Bacillota bacterium]